MRKVILGSGVFAVLMYSVALAAPRADELFGRAREKAAKEGKSIFVDFSASW